MHVFKYINILIIIFKYVQPWANTSEKASQIYAKSEHGIVEYE